MMTRKTRENIKKNANDLLSSEDLIHDEVCKTAIDLHCILTSISNEYTSDAIVNLIPELIILLHRLDASLKVTDDLTQLTKELAEENNILKQKLEKEKLDKSTFLEDSLTMERDAEHEIDSLKRTMNKLETSLQDFQLDLKNKQNIINLLKEENEKLSYQISQKEKEFLRIKSSSKLGQGNYRSPKNTTNPFEKIRPTIDNLQNMISVPQDSDSRATTVQVEVDVHKPQEASQRTAPSVPPIPRNPFSGTEKRRVLVLADSQGKDMYNHLGALFEDFDVFVLSKPGATLKEVVREGSTFFKNFTKEDFVICIAGTNDVGKHEPCQLTIHTGLNELLAAKVDTNIIINEIPYRYDIGDFNNKIFFLNQKIRSVIKSYSGKKSTLICPTNNLLGRSHFTRHGLHFNKHGKRVLGEFYVQRIRQKMQTASRKEEGTGPVTQKALLNPLPEPHCSSVANLDAIEVDVPATLAPTLQSNGGPLLEVLNQHKQDDHLPETYAEAVKSPRKPTSSKISCPATRSAPATPQRSPLVPKDDDATPNQPFLETLTKTAQTT